VGAAAGCFVRKWGEQAEAQLAERTEAARVGIPVTLAAIKAVAEREAGAGS
jgi:hypothetical protein